MKHYETKEIVKKEKVLESITCDCCEESIDTQKEYFNLKVITSIGSWYWKSDESEELQYCSEKCILNDLVNNEELHKIINHDEFETLDIEKVNKKG